MNDFLKNLVPMLGTAISTANPLAGMAFSAIGKVLGVETNDRKDIDKALQTATPDQILQLRKAEMDFSAQMQALGFKNVADLEAIASGDRDSARKMHISAPELTPTVLAYAVTLGFFSILGYVIVNGVPQVGGDAVLILLGTLATAWTSVISFYYGTTSNSRYKDSSIAKLANRE